MRDEGLVVSRQGSGVFVRERIARAVALRPHVERAFEAPKVSVDFAGFSGETLHGVIQEPLDKIRIGQLRPESLTVRILVPDTQVPWGFPCRADDLADEPAFRDRAEQISRRHTDSITESVAELADLGLVGAGSTACGPPSVATNRDDGHWLTGRQYPADRPGQGPCPARFRQPGLVDLRRLDSSDSRHDVADSARPGAGEAARQSARTR